MRMIAVVGTKGQGKDTVAEMIVQELEHNHNVLKIALADRIKKTLATMFDVPLEVFYDEEKKEIPHWALFVDTPRHVMQIFGTEFAQKNYHETIWCDLAYEEICKKCRADEDFVAIITDIRFDHELKYFREKGAEIVFVHRDFEPTPWWKFWEKTHSSEKGLYHRYDSWDDCWIDNHYSKDTLRRDVKRILFKMGFGSNE